MLIRSLLKKSRIRLARDVFATYATHASLANDVIDTDGWAQDGSTHGRAQAKLMLLLEFASKPSSLPTERHVDGIRFLSSFFSVSSFCLSKGFSVSKATLGKLLTDGGGAHMGFSERKDITLN